MVIIITYMKLCSSLYRCWFRGGAACTFLLKTNCLGRVLADLKVITDRFADVQAHAIYTQLTTLDISNPALELPSTEMVTIVRLPENGLRCGGSVVLRFGFTKSTVMSREKEHR